MTAAHRCDSSLQGPWHTWPCAHGLGFTFYHLESLLGTGTGADRWREVDSESKQRWGRSSVQERGQVLSPGDLHSFVLFLWVFSIIIITVN